MANPITAVIQCEEKLSCGINMPKDPDNLTDLEKKHLPIITAPPTVKKGDCFEVAVEVGKLLQHPNEPAHYINFIDLYADHTYLARMDLTSQRTCPTMKICLILDHIHEKLRAFAHCNIHGVWEGQVKIEVTQ